MGMKFLNKKGWHTGSLRNIENVWKAEQKHDAEQKKLEELRKQIHEEREKAEFRELQVQAGLIPRQERLDFLYESGLAVGKGGSSFKELDSLPKTDPGTVAASSSSAAAAAVEKQQPSVPGALFEDKPQSANDTWRKLHSDPLLMIRQREQEALARVKNNPVQMAMIRKSVESKKEKKEKKHKSKKRKKSKHNKHSSSGSDSDRETATLTTEKQRDSRKGSHYDSEGRGEPRSDKRSSHYDSEGRGEPQSDKRSSHYDSEGRGEPRSDKRSSHYDSKGRGESRSDKRSHVGSSDKQRSYHDLERRVESQSDRRSRDVTSERRVESQSDRKSQDVTPERRVEPRDRRSHVGSYEKPRTYHDAERRVEPHSDRRSHDVASGKPPRDVPNSRHRIPVKLSEEERAAKLREMQMDAELHEEQRFKRLKKAAENDAEEAVKDRASQGRSFLDKAHKSVYGAEKGGSSTIEESVRRRSHYLQGKSATTESNAFRRYH